MPTQFRRARIGWRLQSTPVPSEATPVGVLPTQLSRPRTRAQCPLNVEAGRPDCANGSHFAEG